MDIISSFDLTHLNTLGLTARAKRCLKLRSLDDFPNLASQLGASHWFVLGAASNVVLPVMFNGTIVKPEIKGVELLSISEQSAYEIDQDNVLVKAYAGENWHDFVTYCLDNAWYGLENLALIPGTVGAAPIQNIGAYGLEVAQRIHSVCIWDIQEQCFRELSAQQCQFAYRDSIFKQALLGRCIVVSVVFKLYRQNAWRPILHYAELARRFAHDTSTHEISPRAIYEAVIAIRESKLPNPEVLGNAGSFFKNPIIAHQQFSALFEKYPNIAHYPQANHQVKLAAAWLIDMCGLKGQQCGPIGVHQQQALVLVNIGGRGRATEQDVLIAQKWVQAAVLDQFNIVLEPEPVYVSQFDEGQTSTVLAGIT